MINKTVKKFVIFSHTTIDTRFGMCHAMLQHFPAVSFDTEKEAEDWIVGRLENADRKTEDSAFDDCLTVIPVWCNDD